MQRPCTQKMFPMRLPCRSGPVQPRASGIPRTSNRRIFAPGIWWRIAVVLISYFIQASAPASVSNRLTLPTPALPFSPKIG